MTRQLVKIFIDDIRQPVDPDWYVARTVDGATELIERFRNQRMWIPFDHDLGGDATTRTVVNHMCATGIRPAAASIHSANPVGRQWLEAALERDFGGVPVPMYPAPAYHD